MTAKYEPTEKDRKTVKAMAGYGIPQEDICRVIGISPKTMRKNFREEIDIAATEANAQVAQSLFNLATKAGNVAAAIFWMKARAGWTERIVTDNNHHITADTADATRESVLGDIARLAGTAAGQKDT